MGLEATLWFFLRSEIVDCQDFDRVFD